MNNTTQCEECGANIPNHQHLRDRLSRVAWRLAQAYNHEWGGLSYGAAALAYRLRGEEGVEVATALLSVDDETGESIGFSGIGSPSIDSSGTYTHSTGTGRTQWKGRGDYAGDWECGIYRPGDRLVLRVTGFGCLAPGGDADQVSLRHIEAAQTWLSAVRGARVPIEEMLEIVRRGPYEETSCGDWVACADRATEELKEALNELARSERERLEKVRQRSIEAYNAEPTEPEEA